MDIMFDNMGKHIFWIAVYFEDFQRGLPYALYLPSQNVDN